MLVETHDVKCVKIADREVKKKKKVHYKPQIYETRKKKKSFKVHIPPSIHEYLPWI